MMQDQPTFEIADVQGKGIVLIATKDLLPGLELFREPPLLYVSKECLEGLKAGSDSAFAFPLAVFSTFQMMPEDKQKRYLNLFGPIVGTFPEVCIRDKDTGESRSLREEEQAVALKVISIFKYNAFGFSDEGPAMVYELSTRISHSCYPNCFMDSEGDDHICRTVRPIAAGDELTICYNELHSDKPTHFRRQKYLTNKDFTCHCSRCDALGDDTRQFNCFASTSACLTANGSTSNCLGVHLVRQPINKEKVIVWLAARMGAKGIEGIAGKEGTEAHYTGVDYVEPYLLPCTVCGCNPPTKYQQEMFALEARLPRIADDFETRHIAVRTLNHSIIPPPQQCKLWRAFLQDVVATSFPPRHILSRGILCIVVLVTSYIIELDPNPTNLHKNKEAHKQAVLEYAEVIDRIYPIEASMDALMVAAFEVTEIAPTDEELLLGLGYIQRAVRMNSLRHGNVRNRSAEYEGILCNMLEKLEARQALPTVNLSLDQCRLCGESPQRAAIKLLCCAQCLQVAYCSRGCQKAHWKKLHSKTCSKL